MSWINNFLRDKAVQGKVYNQATNQWEAAFDPWSGINTMLGGDPQAAVDAWHKGDISRKSHEKAEESGFSYDQLGVGPDQVLKKGDYVNALAKAKSAAKKQNKRDQLDIVAATQAPQIKATEANTTATLASTAANKEIAIQQILSGNQNAAAERLQQLTMAENADTRAQQQWLRQMEYMDRKEQALKEEKELEALIAGLTMLGANLFV